MIRLVAFDWNGTLLGDLNAVIESENFVRQHYNLKTTNKEEFQNEYDIPIKNYWIAAGFSEQVFDQNSKEIQSLYFSHYEPLEPNCGLRESAKEILSWLKENQIDSIIFSNHPTPHIKVQLERLGLTEFFKEVLGRSSSDDYSHMMNRGKEAKLTEYVKSNNFNSEEVMTVGDTVEEIHIAKNQNFFSTALTGGFNSEERLTKEKPDYLIHNLAELVKIIQNINNGRIIKTY